MLQYNGKTFNTETAAMKSLMSDYPSAGDERLVELSESLFEEVEIEEVEIEEVEIEEVEIKDIAKFDAEIRRLFKYDDEYYQIDRLSRVR